MIVHTHVHVWEIDPPRYPIGLTAPNWKGFPDEPGTADELLAEMDDCGIDCTVLVQTSWSTWDNGYIAEPPFALVQHPVRRFANDIARGGVDEEVFLFDSDGERRLRERHPDLALALL